MARVPKVATGTYDGKRFELLDCVIHTYGTEYIRRVDAFVIEFLEGGKKYVLDNDPLLRFDHDPLLRFDTIRLED